ncbi:hypothetical protein FWG95_02165 [Candidatus Saccharibacteria bacterium]|nr:hypothetical protein [Candidatus Saccharibacteria bacterium]
MVESIRAFKKGAFGLFAAFALAVSVLAAGFSGAPASALSPSSWLYVDGTDIVLGGVVTGSVVAGASYDEPTNTLTFDNYTGNWMWAEYMDNLNIVLVGTNTFTQGTMSSSIMGFYYGTSVTISGSGTLNVNHTGTGSTMGIEAEGNVTIASGATVNINMASASFSSYGIFTDGSINIANGANVTIDVDSTTFYAMAANAINIGAGAVIKEGLDVASAVTVPSLTLVPSSGLLTTLPFVSIMPGSTTGGGGDIVDNTNNPATGDVNFAVIVGSSMVALVSAVLGTLMLKRRRAAIKY